jgi:hypothetical protein
MGINRLFNVGHNYTSHPMATWLTGRFFMLTDADLRVRFWN